MTMVLKDDKKILKDSKSFPRSLLPISRISLSELCWEQPSVISTATLKFSSQGKWMRQSLSNDQREGALKCTVNTLMLHVNV